MLKTEETSGGEMIVQIDSDTAVRVTEIEVIEIDEQIDIEIRRIEDDRTVTVRFV